MNEQQKAESKITFIFYCVVIIVLGGLTLGFASGFLSFPTDSQVNLERTLTEGDLQLINEIVDAKLLEQRRYIDSQMYTHDMYCHDMGQC